MEVTCFAYSGNMSLEIEIIVDSDTEYFNAVSEVGGGAGDIDVGNSWKRTQSLAAAKQNRL